MTRFYFMKQIFNYLQTNTKYCIPINKLTRFWDGTACMMMMMMMRCSSYSFNEKKKQKCDNSTIWNRFSVNLSLHKIQLIIIVHEKCFLRRCSASLKFVCRNYLLTMIFSFIFSGTLGGFRKTFSFGWWMFESYSLEKIK